MIKYRVWDTVAKEYLDESAVSINGHGGLAVFDGANILVATQLPGSTSPRFIIEQYTGLKDKNGVEIAVGDIVGLYEIYVDPDGTEAEWLEPWGEVVRTATAMMVKSVRTGTFIDIIDDGEDPSEPMAEVEVIGNIHENAELLEEYKSGE